jgi:hypothetical protein
MASIIKEEQEQEQRKAQQLQPVVVGNAGPAILGIKFLDGNRDGIRQPNETGLANIPFLLEPATGANGVFDAGTAEFQTRTDANGAFSFINLVPGNYVITETIPPGLSSNYSQSRRCHSWKHKRQPFIWQQHNSTNSRQPDRWMQIPRPRWGRLSRWR